MQKKLSLLSAPVPSQTKVSAGLNHKVPDSIATDASETPSTDLSCKHKQNSGKCLKAIRSFCLGCQGGASRYVDSCSDQDCELHPYRLPANPINQGDLSGSDNSGDPEGNSTELRPLRAVRRHCIACAGDRKESRKCTARQGCLLWSFRFGVNPETYRKVMKRFRDPKVLLLPGFKE